MRRFAFAFALVLLAACTTNQTAASLDGTNWTLAGSPHITLAFADGRATGSGGCNQYFATYTESASALTFSSIGSTKRACVEEDRNRAEVAYLEALEKTASYAISGNTLTLRDAAGAAVLELTRR